MKQEPLNEIRRSSLESNNENGDEVPKNIPRLHIPRASLSSSTSSSKGSSIGRSREFSPSNKASPMREISGEFLSESDPEGIYMSTSIHHSKSQIDGNPNSRKNLASSRNKYLVHKAQKPSSLHSLSSTASSSLSTSGSNQSNYVS